MGLSVRLITIATVVCSPCANAQTIIPAATGRLDPAEARDIQGMRYHPVDRPLRWLSNGTLIVAHVEQYSYADVSGRTCKGSGIFVVSANGKGAVEPLAIGRAGCDAITGNGVAVDPTGHWILYSVHVLPNNSRLVRLDLDAGRPDTLQTVCAIYHEYPSVSPSGRQVAAHGMCRERAGEFAIYLSDADGSHLRRVIATDSVSNEQPDWSPDGAHLTFVRARWAGENEKDDVAIADTNGGSMRVLAAGRAPAWSPDGKWIAFLAPDTRARGEYTIHLIRPDGSGERRAFANPTRTTYSRGWGLMPEGSPREPLVWSPDGSALAFSRAFDAGVSVWRLDLSSRTVRPITAPATRARRNAGAP
jgi:dipeptidyl aminopeptidase/acylaminoacyl peptidase